MIQVLAVLLFLSPAVARANDEPRIPLGPDAVPRQIAVDEEPKSPVFRSDSLSRNLAPYFDWKKRLQTDHAFSFGIDYTAVWLYSSASLGDDSAGSGDFRIFGSWDLFEPDSAHPGGLVYKVEQRHRYGGGVAPSDFGFEIGYIGLFEPPFSNQEWRLTNLYWRQRFSEGRYAAVGGWVDTTDYLDVYALASPWLHFMNFVFSTGSATIPVPAEGLGLAAAGYLTDHLYVIGGFADSNSDPHDPGAGFHSFASEREYFSHLELGLTTKRERNFLDNVHVSYWHADPRRDAGVEDGWGLAFGASLYVDDRWLPFVRGGYARKGGSLLEWSLSLGLGYQPVAGRDLLGVAFNYGVPNESTFAPGLDDQYTSEVFYRVTLSERFALTPSVQYIRNPALNPDESSAWVFGLRGRLAL